MFREIKKQIKNMVDPVTPLSYEVHPEREVFPHAVGFMGNSFVREGLYNIVLDIDIWDRNQSTKNIDEIAQEIINRLDRWAFTNEKVHFSIYLVNEFYVEDEDKSIRRKTCIFDVQARKGK